MEATIENRNIAETEEQQDAVRNLVVAGLEQIKTGKTKDFNAVCDRLEKRYTSEAISY
ncbi:MAG: hypothetical protein IKB07_07360 [Lachnospiraceae bacterium]|nr:hypothetical protein [Lachnospiraceae bacterium]